MESKTKTMWEQTHKTYTHDDYVFTHMTRRFCDLATVAFYFGSQADPYT